MNKTLFLQLHVHSNRSFDANTTISEYVSYLNSVLPKNEIAALGITDHNVLPITAKEALRISTNKVIVIPGIQWRLHKSWRESLVRLCTRREILTVGIHDDLFNYIKQNTDYEITSNGYILGHLTENEFLDYISKNNKIIIIIPHPRHFFFDFYGEKEMSLLKQKMDKKKILIPFFVEESTGYDPFPRIGYNYKKDYPIIGSSDAHEIFSIFKTNSLFSVQCWLPINNGIVRQWNHAYKQQDIKKYYKTILMIFNTLVKQNNKIQIKKSYIRTIAQFLHAIPYFFKRRLQNFPKNLLE